jgi:2-dehydropantoate 2-reductase
MRLLMLGAGAVGGYFGARLIEAGANVTFLVRPARRRALETSGLLVKSGFGDAHLAPQLLSFGESAGPFDLALLSCKAYDLDDAIATLAPFVTENTLVIPLLNGVAHLEPLRRAFGEARLMGGYAGIGATLGENGEVLHFDSNQFIGFGALQGEAPPPLAELAAAFAHTPVEAIFSDEIETLMWAKYAFLTALAAATCLIRASVGEILETPAGPALMEALFSETLAVAKASGIELSEARMAGYRAHLFTKGSRSTASMLRDMQRGARTENEHIIGHMIALAHRFALPAEKLELAHSHILAYERRLPS